MVDSRRINSVVVTKMKAVGQPPVHVRECLVCVPVWYLYRACMYTNGSTSKGTSSTNSFTVTSMYILYMYKHVGYTVFYHRTLRTSTTYMYFDCRGQAVGTYTCINEE